MHHEDFEKVSKAGYLKEAVQEVIGMGVKSSMVCTLLPTATGGACVSPCASSSPTTAMHIHTYTLPPNTPQAEKDENDIGHDVGYFASLSKQSGGAADAHEDCTLKPRKSTTWSHKLHAPRWYEDKGGLSW